MKLSCVRVDDRRIDVISCDFGGRVVEDMIKQGNGHSANHAGKGEGEGKQEGKREAGTWTRKDNRPTSTKGEACLKDSFLDGLGIEPRTFRRTLRAAKRTLYQLSHTPMGIDGFPVADLRYLAVVGGGLCEYGVWLDVGCVVELWWSCRLGFMVEPSPSSPSQVPWHLPWAARSHIARSVHHLANSPPQTFAAWCPPAEWKRLGAGSRG